MGCFEPSVLDDFTQNLKLVFKYRIYRKITQIQDNIGSFLKNRKYRKYRTSAKPVIDQYSAENLLQDPASICSKQTIDLLIGGDMCYDDQLAGDVLKLIRTARQDQIQVLLADPGWYSFKTVMVNHLKETMKRACERPIVDRDYIESEFRTVQI
jgi:predicted nicotinamide N-methyase